MVKTESEPFQSNRSSFSLTNVDTRTSEIYLVTAESGRNVAARPQR